MEIIEINKQEWTEQEGLSSTGKRVKAWYVRNSDNKSFLYKIPKRNENGFLTYEMWTEIIAYYVGKELGLEIPPIYPARDGESYGVLVADFLLKQKEEGKVTEEEELHEAQEFLKGIYPESKYYHNLTFIRKILSRKLFLNVNNLNFEEEELRWYKFKKMLVFDCLIGNNDRHDQNWGLCFSFDFRQIKTKILMKIKLSPIYDNASCLAKELNEEAIQELLSHEQKFRKYISGKKSKPPNLYWDENDPKHYTHYQLMQKLIEKEPETKQMIEEFLQIDYINPVYDIIKEIQDLDLPPEYRISDNRAKAIIKILEARKEKMRELL